MTGSGCLTRNLLRGGRDLEWELKMGHSWMFFFLYFDQTGSFYSPGSFEQSFSSSSMQIRFDGRRELYGIAPNDFLVSSPLSEIFDKKEIAASLLKIKEIMRKMRF